MKKVQIIKRRVEAVRRALKRERTGFFLVTKPANVAYTTGFSGDYSWAAITKGGVYLLTDSRYIEQAKSECPGCRIIERGASLTEAASKLVKKLKSVSRQVGIEKSTSLADFEKLKEKIRGRVKTTADIIEKLRAGKDNSEIASIKKAAQIAAEALKKTRRHIKPGSSENELAGVLDFEIRKLGALTSFETIVAFGANASRPHHQPGARRLKKNDTVLIDFGVRYENYCCDLTRSFAVGKVSALYRKAYDAVKEAQAAAIKMIKPGVEKREVDARARAVIKKYDLPVYGHGTGHGLGLEVHEEPVISGESKGRLQAGMVFTIEPGVYIPGRLGVRIEDDVLVTDSGCKILSGKCLHLPFGAA